MDWRLRDVNFGLQGGKTLCASFCPSLIAGSRRAFLFVDCVRLRLFVSVCVVLWEFWVWMKYKRCERLPLVKAFLFCFNFVVVFSSLENYFGFRTTNVRVKTDHPSAWGGIKRFEHFQRGLSFSDNCAFDLWIDFVSSASPSFARLN